MKRAVKMRFPSLSAFRVGYQTFEASHLVPETDRGLQERGHHRPDVLLEQWHGPLCPHPQIQASADVGTSPSLQRCCSSYLRALTQYLSSPLEQLKSLSGGCAKHSCHDSSTCTHFCLLLATCKTLDSFRNAGRHECISDLAAARYVNGV